VPEIPDQPKGQDSDDEVLTPVELLLYEHFRYLACPSPVDPVDTDDCASMAVEVIRFLTEKGVIQDQASAYRAGREDAARDILALPDAELPRGHVDRAWIALVARGGPGQDRGAHTQTDGLLSVAAPCTCRWCRNRAGRG
jgi:hypothetical protein